MSQLIDMLNRVARAVPQPMGFKSAQPAAAKPQLLLIAGLAQTENVNGLMRHLSGADAALLRIGDSEVDAKAMQKLARPLANLPWGAWLKDADEKLVGAIVEAGADFVVFPAAGAVSAIPRDDKLGKVLQVEASPGEGVMRAINDLPVDAVMVGDDSKQEHISWNDLMFFQRSASQLNKPLLVYTPPELATFEIKTLWDLGVDAIVVQVSKEQPADRLKDLRQAISKMSGAPRRKRGKTEALVPAIKMGTQAEAEEEEE